MWILSAMEGSVYRTRKGGANGQSYVEQYNFHKTQEAHELLERDLALPENERAELAGNLISSLETTVDPDVDAAWQAEIPRRAQ